MNRDSEKWLYMSGWCVSWLYVDCRVEYGIGFDCWAWQERMKCRVYDDVDAVSTRISNQIYIERKLVWFFFLVSRARRVHFRWPVCGSDDTVLSLATLFISGFPFIRDSSSSLTHTIKCTISEYIYFLEWAFLWVFAKPQKKTHNYYNTTVMEKVSIEFMSVHRTLAVKKKCLWMFYTRIFHHAIVAVDVNSMNNGIASMITFLWTFKNDGCFFPFFTDDDQKKNEIIWIRMVLFFGYFFSHVINDYGHLRIEQNSHLRNRHIFGYIEMVLWCYHHRPICSTNESK